VLLLLKKEQGDYKMANIKINDLNYSSSEEDSIDIDTCTDENLNSLIYGGLFSLFPNEVECGVPFRHGGCMDLSGGSDWRGVPYL
jgi:hypothetical protein